MIQENSGTPNGKKPLILSRSPTASPQVHPWRTQHAQLEEVHQKYLNAEALKFERMEMFNQFWSCET